MNTHSPLHNDPPPTNAAARVRIKKNRTQPAELTKVVSEPRAFFCSLRFDRYLMQVAGVKIKAS